MVVDDEENSRNFFTRALARSRWKSVIVKSGEMALEKLEEQRYELIF
ncbi:MAG: hypothetical protein ACE5Q6_03165 [Dehalococcoidia bacterium]